MRLHSPLPRAMLAALVPAILAVAPLRAGDLVPFKNAEGKPHVVHQRHPGLVEDAKDGKITLTNVRWGFSENNAESAQFKTTTFDPNRVKDVFYWSEDFAPKWLAAHGMLTFVMDDVDAVQAEDGSQDIGFILSIEAFLLQGQKYNLFKGLNRKNFAVVHSVTSLTDRLQWGIVMRDHRFDQYRLKIDQAQKVALARRALLHSTTPREEERYHLTRNSCIVGAAEAINTVLEKGRKINMWWVPGLVRDMEMAYPKTFRLHLLRKGIVERAPRILEGVKRLRYPTKSGKPYEIDLTKMPGFRLGSSVLPFDDALENFFQYTDVLDDLAKLQSITSPMDPKLMKIHHAMGETEDIANEILLHALDKMAEHPVETLDHYLKLDLDDSEAVRAVDAAIVQRLTPKAGGDPALDALLRQARKVFDKRK